MSSSEFNYLKGTEKVARLCRMVPKKIEFDAANTRPHSSKLDSFSLFRMLSSLGGIRRSYQPLNDGGLTRTTRPRITATGVSFCLLITLLALGIFRAISSPPTVEYRRPVRNMTRDDVLQGTFNPIYRHIQWVHKGVNVCLSLGGTLD